jgi:cytochrome P450
VNSPLGGVQHLYDPFSDTSTTTIYDKYRLLRDGHPVYHNPARDVWCLSRYEDVLQADRNWQTFSNADGVDLDAPAFFGTGDFLDTDPPLHDHLRGLVQSWFTRDAVRRLQDRIDGRVVSVLDNLDSGPVDLASDFVWHIPIWVVCTILGIPISDLDQVHAWLTRLSTRPPDGEAPSAAAFAARDTLRDYLADLAKERSRRPTDDLMTSLAQSAARNELTMDELVGMSVLLFAAGSETTAGLVTSGLVALDSHRQDQTALRSGDADLLIAIEEMLRFDSPIQYLARTTTDDVDLHGTVIPRGARVVLLYGAANRDERRFESADAFDIRRNPRRHLAFGNGIHSCLGQQLARLEGDVIFRRFFERVTRYELTGEPTRLRHPIIRAIVNLPAQIVRA